MNTGRRSFLSSFSTLAVTLAGARALPADPLQRHGPPQLPGINDPNNPAPGTEGPPPPHLDPKEQLKQDQKNIRRDVDRLLELAKNLKDESDKTPDTDVLSLSLVKKAEEIEKLAHQIKDRIRET